MVSSRVSSTPGSLQRSRSDVDVNAATTAKSRMPKVPAAAPFSSAGALPPGSYASLGNTLHTHLQRKAFNVKEDIKVDSVMKTALQYWLIIRFLLLFHLHNPKARCVGLSPHNQ